MQSKIMNAPKGNPEEIDKIKIRKASSSDLEAVYQIECEQFPNPWKKKYFSEELLHDIANFYVAEDKSVQQVIGYVIFWIVEEMLELHKIAVSASYTGRGIGKRLFRFMLEKAVEQGVEELFLEVRKSNIGAIKLYESFAFKQIDIRKDYYNEPTEDALIFKLILSPGNE